LEGKIMRKLTLVTIGVATLALAGCGDPEPKNTTAAPEAAAPVDNMAVSSSAGDPAVADNVTAPADIANMSAPSDTTAPSSSSDGKIK
jgi:uncharacterized lipoprotein YajG